MLNTPESQQAAHALGIDLQSRASTQRWVPDFPTGYIIDQLITEDGTVIPYRVLDTVNGVLNTKVPEDARTAGNLKVVSDHTAVDQAHADVVKIQAPRNKLIAAIQDMVPGVGPEDFVSSVSNGRPSVSLKNLTGQQRGQVRSFLAQQDYGGDVDTSDT